MSTPALETRGLTVSYGTHPALWDVNSAFPRGAMSAIVGPNGAGKSTLLKASLGLVAHESGQCRVFGVSSHRNRAAVAFVPQTSDVDWDFPVTVREVVAMGRYGSAGWFRRLRHEDRRIVAEALEQVGMTALSDRQIGRLSGGQRQRVFLARALAQRAPLLLLDEPFAGVDANTERALLKLLRELRDRGQSIVAVHHDLDTVRESFDWALVLNVHAIVEGPVGDVITPSVLSRAYGEGMLSTTRPM